jgi:hypothetical protein
MNTLTQEQVIKLAKQHGMSFGVKILPESPLFNNKQCLVDFANAAFALRLAQGIRREKDRINSAIPQYFAELERPSIKAESTAIRARK